MKIRIILFLLFIAVTINVNAQTTGDNAITYIHAKPVSFKSQFLKSSLIFAGMKNDVEKKMTKQSFSQEAAPLPKSLTNNFDVKCSNKNGHRYWIIQPKQDKSEKVILYMHGGAYILSILKSHWTLIEELVSETKATIIIPDYPLAPAANYLDVYNFIEAIYPEILSLASPQNFIIMGDSAGAGFALGFAQKLRNENKVQPSQIILLSPWLDITMSNPDLVHVDKKDKILGIKGLQMAGKAYAGPIDTKDFKVSPVYGDFSDLGKISIFIGTHDLCISDSRKLRGILENEAIPINFFEYPKMFHDWIIITNLKESRHAISQITSLIKNENPIKE